MTDEVHNKVFNEAPSALQSNIGPRPATSTAPIPAADVHTPTMMLSLPPIAKDTDVTCMPFEFFRARNQMEQKGLAKTSKERERDAEEKDKEKEKEREKEHEKDNDKTFAPALVTTRKEPTLMAIPANSPNTLAGLKEDEREREKEKEHEKEKEKPARKKDVEKESKTRRTRSSMRAKDSKERHNKNKKSKSSRRSRGPSKTEFKTHVTRALINETMRLMVQENKDNVEPNTQNKEGH